MWSFLEWLWRCLNCRVGGIALVVLVLVVLIFGSFFLPSTRRAPIEEYSYLAMGTFCRVVIAAGSDRSVSGRAAAEAALEKIKLIEALASTYRADSEVSQLSDLPPGSPKVLSPEIYNVLDRSVYYSNLTGGAFDVTVGPLVRLWKEAAKGDVPPSAEELAKALEAVGYHKITLEAKDRTIILDQRGMSITLDAIVKGYAADLALAVIRDKGVPAGLVDLGGDVVCYGHPLGQDFWRIGIQNPFQPADVPMDISPGSLLTSIKLTDAAVATSGNYQRTFRIQDRAYSQILDPRTGEPVAQAPSVTIIAPSAADADALATACSVLPVAEAIKLINSIPDTEALLITGSAEAPVFHSSEGFEKYLLWPLPD